MCYVSKTFKTLLWHVNRTKKVAKVQRAIVGVSLEEVI